MDYMIAPFSERGIIVEFGDTICPETHAQVRKAALYVEAHPFPGYMEYVAAYTTLAVFYDPLSVRSAFKASSAYKEVSRLMEEYLEASKEVAEPPANVVEIPVCYGGEFGPDLEFVAENAKLTTEEVITLHTAPDYLVYMIGFCPGFPYMGGMDPRIASPRRQTPRLEIPARSIGIAGQQTGGYPISTPGGWQLIGRTPMELFLPKSDPPSLLSSGDIVRFNSITIEEYEEIICSVQCTINGSLRSSLAD